MKLKIPKIIPAMIFRKRLPSLGIFLLKKRTQLPIIAAEKNTNVKKPLLPALSVKTCCVYFIEESTRPAPANTNNGNVHPDSDDSLLLPLADKYTADSAINRPIVFRKEKVSLYRKTASSAGITKDILLAIVVEATPFFCEDKAVR